MIRDLQINEDQNVISVFVMWMAVVSHHGGGDGGGWGGRPMDFPCTRKGQREPVKLAGQPLPVLTWGQQREDGGESTD